MKTKWKRNWNNKNYNFEIDYLLNIKLNGSSVILPKIYLEDPDLQDQIKSVCESYILDTLKRNEEVKKQNDLNDERTRVRNHFRNVCFRKKFSTIRDHIKYISSYYQISELKTMEYVADDIDIIKKQAGLK